MTPGFPIATHANVPSLSMEEESVSWIARAGLHDALGKRRRRLY
jgi:hypothetical protein